jgi:hypothetical protein
MLKIPTLKIPGLTAPLDVMRVTPVACNRCHGGATGIGRGITMLRLMQLRLAATALFTAAAVSLTAASALAFTRENVRPDANGNYTFTDPDDRVTNSAPGARPFGSNGPTVQFGIQQGPVSPFGRSPGNGYNGSPPDPYYRPFGTRN